MTRKKFNKHLVINKRIKWQGTRRLRQKECLSNIVRLDQGQKEEGIGNGLVSGFQTRHTA